MYKFFIHLKLNKKYRYKNNYMIAHRKFVCYYNDYFMLPTSLAIYIFM